MSTTALTGWAALALVVIYSVIMMATSGSAGWAWLLLVAAAILIGISARGRLQGESPHGG